MPVIFKGFSLTEDKYQKLVSNQPVYVRFQEATELHSYVTKLNDEMGAGLRKRLRSLSTVLSSQASYYLERLCVEGCEKDAQNVFTDFKKSCDEYAQYCQSEVDHWAVIGSFPLEEFGLAFAAPWVVLVSGLLAAKLGMNPKLAMEVSLLCHVGFLELSPLALRTIIDKSVGDLTEEELSELKQVPLETLEQYKGLEKVSYIQGLEDPIFVYAKPHEANNFELDSPLGDRKSVV